VRAHDSKSRYVNLESSFAAPVVQSEFLRTHCAENTLAPIIHPHRHMVKNCNLQRHNDLQRSPTLPASRISAHLPLIKLFVPRAPEKVSASHGLSRRSRKATQPPTPMTPRTHVLGSGMARGAKLATVATLPLMTEANVDSNAVESVWRIKALAP
jgi:hypothetical protein